MFANSSVELGILKSVPSIILWVNLRGGATCSPGAIPGYLSTAIGLRGIRGFSPATPPRASSSSQLAPTTSTGNFLD